MLGNLTPVTHYTNPKLYRVPIKREGDEYIVCVADNFVRNFTKDSLPDEVKTKLTMVMAASRASSKDWEIFNTDLYVPRFPIEGFAEIGWQASDSYYCVCVSVECLNEMRGEK